MTTAELLERVSPAVVKLVLLDDAGKPAVYEAGNQQFAFEGLHYSPGVVVSEDGLILAALHWAYYCAASSNEMVAHLDDGRALRVVGITAMDPESDLALLKVRNEGLAYLPVAPWETRKKDAALFAISGYSDRMEVHTDKAEIIDEHLVLPVSVEPGRGTLCPSVIVSEHGHLIGLRGRIFRDGKEQVFITRPTMARALLGKVGSTRPLSGLLDLPPHEELRIAIPAVSHRPVNDDAAGKVYEELSRDHTNEAVVWRGLAEFLDWRCGRKTTDGLPPVELPASLLASDRLLSLRPNDAEALWLHGRAKMRAKGYRRATTSFRKALSAYPPVFGRGWHAGRRRDLYYNKAACHAALGDYDQALSDVLAGKEARRKELGLMELRNDSSLETQEMQDDIGRMSGTMEVLEVPDYRRGLDYYRAGRYDDAADKFREVIPLTPFTDSAYLQLASCHYETEDFKSAAPLFWIAGELGDGKGPLGTKGQAECFYNSGISRTRISQHGVAVEAFTRAIEADESFAPAYLARALCREIVGEDSAALRDYKLAIKYADDAETRHKAQENLARVERRRADGARRQATVDDTGRPSGPNAATTPKWQVRDNWRKLKMNMTEEEVIAILGQPTRKSVIVGVIRLSYGNGSVTLKPPVLGGAGAPRVDSWMEP